MRYQVNICSIVIKLKPPLRLREFYRSFDCSLFPMEVMGALKDEKK